MKNIFSPLLAALLLLCALAGQAQTIRRVNNTGLVILGANIYTTLQAAHDVASAGDIIYLEPSNISYGNLTCTRPLTIIGNGYFLGQNPGLQLDIRESEAGSITFANGSAGSRITGCVISVVNIGASNVTVERNNITSICYVGYNPTVGGGSVGVSNIIFRQNYMSSNGVYLYPGSTAATSISNVNITNNILPNIISATGNYINLGNILISNNVIGNLAGTSGASIQVDNAVIKNNILTQTTGTSSFTPRNNAYSYNISGNGAFGTASGNQQNIAPSSIFVGGIASTDGAFQLRTGSPAIGAGDNGVDIGAYGGTIPYRIAGIPNVPTIYQYNQTVSGNSLNATISTRSNN